jgi:hypothetical protein
MCCSSPGCSARCFGAHGSGSQCRLNSGSCGKLLSVQVCAAVPPGRSWAAGLFAACMRHQSAQQVSFA